MAANVHGLVTESDDGRPAWLGAHQVSLTGPDLDQVIGLRNAKREVVSLLARLLNPEDILEASGELPTGVLFNGPPGCGKTLLARLMAFKLKQGGDAAEFFSIAASDLSSARFEEIAAWVAHRPTAAPRVVAYLDEIDYFGRDRDDYRHTETTRATLLGALAAMDGVRDDGHSRVLWLASSNRSVDELDAALVRAGRFGFAVRISWPSREDRAEILRFYASTRRVEPDIDWIRAAALAGARTSPGSRQND